VPQSRPGERGAALTQGGGYAHYVTAAAPLGLPAPQSLSLLEAAVLPEALFAAWFNIFDMLRLQAGDAS
jgi:NADPH:quinone reductase-like Zn-dependent oxidoreductase